MLSGFSGNVPLNEYNEQLIARNMYAISFVERVQNKDITNPLNTRVVNDTLTTEEQVRKFFLEAPEMIEVARCESHFRHHDQNGQVLRGMANGYDVGVMQINEMYHGKRALELGIDIYNIEGNLEYAMYLYQKSGLDPWRASKPCWGQTHELTQR